MKMESVQKHNTELKTLVSDSVWQNKDNDNIWNAFAKLEWIVNLMAT